ncbi:putative uncharacterized protein [Clostridium sp. CAG:226]|nr:putative uncharacterized protein [Clostridium sp. CAG:226]
MGDPHTRGIAAFLARKGVVFSAKRYLVDAMGSMAMGLFASLLIGTILSTLADKLSLDWLKEIASFASAATGSAMAVAIGLALQAPPLVLFSLCAVGYGANSLGGPLGTLICTAVAAELGKIVSKETKVDILVTPTVTIVSGLLIARLAGPGVSAVMTGFGNLIMRATEMHPFFMGILVSVLVGVALTLPISSAAICASFGTAGLIGLAGGAATAGCCAQMVGFAVMSFKENRYGGLVAQGLGTSMLQMGNIVKNPRIWLPPTIFSAITGPIDSCVSIVSAITGPIASCVFKMENGVGVASGMGTCGLVGPIGVMASEGFGSAKSWIGMLLVCFILPAVLTPLVAYPMRKLGWIKDGDLKLEL